MRQLVEAARTRRFQALTAVIVMMAISGIAFQNCSAQKFSADQSSLETFYSTSAVTINGGAQYTNDANVKVQIKASSSIVEIYMTNDSSCTSGGAWLPVASEKPWVLGQTNKQAEVFVKFRPKGGAPLPCISATIIHDDIPPSVAIGKAPGAYSGNLVEDVEFRGDDSGSGLAGFECRFTGQANYKSCSALEKLSILIDASALVNLQVRSLDKAGNRSPLLERAWLIDRTAPGITITDKPASSIALNSASVSYLVSDETNGSGLDKVYCQLDSGTVKVGCSLTEVLQNLADGPHVFNIWATDKAGNESPKAQAMWTVTTPPPGSFQILGISSTPGIGATGADTEVNDILGVSPVPRVTWSAASGAASYSVSILNAGGTQVCAPVTQTAGASNSFGFSAAQCTLSDATKYVAKVTPFASQNGVAGTAQTFPFAVDISGPVITVQPAVLTADQKSATVKFSITDAGTGVRDATCKKTYKGNDQTFACKDLMTYTFTNLADGDHVFSITATDGAQNVRTSSPITFTSKLIICDPFSTTLDGLCKKGLKGNIYYLTGDQLTNPFGNVNEYISKGKLAAAILYLSQVFVPTRSFSAGFLGDEQVAIKDDSGAKLIEYFALDLTTVLKLKMGDANGRYQFALLSDDGAVLETQDSMGRWNLYLDNDGDHSTRLGCDTTGLVFDANSRIPMRIKYYQGPRTEIAMTLLWRYRTSADKLDDVDCGVSSSTAFFGPNYTDQTNKYKFGQLLDRNWRVLTSDNFVTAD